MLMISFDITLDQKIIPHYFPSCFEAIDGQIGQKPVVRAFLAFGRFVASSSTPPRRMDADIEKSAAFNGNSHTPLHRRFLPSDVFGFWRPVLWMFMGIMALLTGITVLLYFFSMTSAGVLVYAPFDGMRIQ